MTIVYVLLSLILLLLLVLLILLMTKKGEGTAFIEIGVQLRHLQEEIRSVEVAVRFEISDNRREAVENDRSARKELAASLAAFEEKLNHLTGTTDAKLAAFNEGAVNQAKDTRQEIRTSLEVFRKDFAAQITAFSELQNDLFQRLLAKQSEQNTDTSQKLEKLRDTLEKSLGEMSSANEKKLEQMRQTVDEKLQQTLETRLGESFRLVSERLESVHKGLGDMQQLATGVGDLKRVLNNVKTRGVLGEYQLANLLEHLMTPDQYDKNVKTRIGSNALVEFAVKMPGRHQTDGHIYLPIDSKFPKDQYDHLQQAYDEGVPELIESQRQQFIRAIKKCASEISDKYLDTPNTTNFAILFLPFESLYAEVIRVPGLFENIRNDCRVIITGPTTLAALLSSLQVGFQTLAIEKRSGEVWQLLGGVKTEFRKFSELLQKAQSNIQTGLHQLDDVVGKRTRAIEKRLNGVEESVAPALPEIRENETEPALPEIRENETEP